MTNEERIRSVTEEELAHFLSSITGEIGYDLLNGAPGFHEYVNDLICQEDVCPISEKPCLMAQGIDDSCPYKPLGRESSSGSPCLQRRATKKSGAILFMG